MGAFRKGNKVKTAQLKRAKIMLPELDEGNDKGYILVRGLTAKEVREKLAKGPDGAEKKTQDADIILLCAINEDGTPIFDSADDVNENLDVSAESLLAIVVKICEISGIPATTTGQPKN